jgi:hypothetical protein
MRLSPRFSAVARIARVARGPAVSLATLALLVPLVGCMRHDGGPVTTETRHLAQSSASRPSHESFSRIDLRGPIDVVVHEGGETTIAVTGDQSMQARVRTRVEGDTLVVDVDDDESHCFGICIERNPAPAQVTVDLPALRSATIEGSGDLTVEASGAHAEVDFDLRGSGDVRYTGNAELVRCTLEGSGDVVLRGEGTRLEARVHGSGDVEAREFPVTSGLYEIEGSGDIATVVHGGEMTVQIEGSGDLSYAGNAHITNLDVSGSGTIRQL